MSATQTDSSRSEAARNWIARWDRQQEGFLPEREAQFAALIDAVEETSGRPDPLVVDLGCGPGSIAVRLLERIPGATVVAVDADPLLIELGRSAWGSLPGLRFVDADLRDPGWSSTLELERAPDAVVSTTALHWLAPATLNAVYAEVRRLLRPNGILLNGDEFEADRETSPVLSRLDRALLTRERSRRHPAGTGESWHGWWAGIAAAPQFAEAVAERDRRGYDGQHHTDLSAALSVHLDALHAAGFTEIGVIWQRGEDRLLCAVAGPRETS